MARLVGDVYTAVSGKDRITMIAGQFQSVFVSFDEDGFGDDYDEFVNDKLILGTTLNGLAAKGFVSDAAYDQASDALEDMMQAVLDNTSDDDPTAKDAIAALQAIGTFLDTHKQAILTGTLFQ
ncbi:MAG: hypothetical protein AAF698_06460 [Pseudomonadota bacterium]